MLLLFPIVAFSQERADVPKKQLAIISAYNEAAPWPRKYISLISQMISNRKDFNTASVTHLNNIIIYDEEGFNRLQDGVFSKLSDNKPDYVVLIGNFAFTLRERIKKEWGDIPMLLIAKNNKYGPLDYYFTDLNASDTVIPPILKPLEDLRPEYNFSFVRTPNKDRETVDMMIQMFPDMKKLVFMSDPLYDNRHLSHMLREYLKLKYPDIKYEWLVASDKTSMQPYLNNLDFNVGLLLSTWYYVSPGANGYPLMRSGDSYLIDGAHRPVFGLRYSYFPYGILGGYFNSVEETEKDVLAAMSDLISGKEMRDVPFREPSVSMPIIDYERMESFGIEEFRCPKNTLFLNKPKTFWENYGRYVYIAGGVLLLLIIFLVVYVIQVKRRAQISRAYDKLVSSMPIGYVQAIVDLSSEGKVKGVRYGRRNKTFMELNEVHDLKSIKTTKSDEYWQEIADSMVATSCSKSSIFPTPDGQAYIEFILSPEAESTDSRLVVDIFVIDVSDKMKVEQALREAANKAVEADNMKSVFLANMSHEIRTPLNAIVGFSGLLCKTEDIAKKKKFINIIETNNQLLLKLIGDILDISKAESDKLVFNMNTVDVNKLINIICSGFDMTDHPDVRLVVDLGMKECLVTSDSYRLTQILDNLITNAIKFTQRGSITVGYRPEGNMIKFFVKDTGLGIAASDMSSLFNRFIKLNSFVQGSGLGLSISKAVVEKLGGTIKAESPGRGKGSTFWFTIPNVLEKHPDGSDLESDDFERVEKLRKNKIKSGTTDDNIVDKESAQDKAMPSYKQERKKLLVVEDNASNYELYVALFDGRYDLVHAWDGEEAISLFAKETPDLVLMDIGIPIKNGYEATAEIRMLSKTVPVIAVTAYAQPDDKEKIRKRGFNAFVPKPIDNELLLHTIRKFI